MNEMVERVARAMCERQPAFDGTGRNAQRWTWDRVDEPSKQYWRANARAAIEAMREPTEAMIEASHEEGASWDEYARGYVASEWRRMIDAALAQPRHRLKSPGC